MTTENQNQPVNNPAADPAAAQADQAQVNNNPGNPEATAPSNESDNNATRKEGEQKTNSVQKRISEITARYHQEARAREQLQAQLVENNRQMAEALARQNQQPQPGAEQFDAPPTLEQFDFDETRFATATREYFANLAQKTVQEKVQETLSSQEQQAAQRRQEQQRSEQVTRFQQSEVEFAQNNPDYFDVVQNPGFGQSQSVVDAVLASDNPAAVTYALAKDPALTAKVNQLPPIQAAREIALLEQRLQVQPRTVTNAPDPINSDLGGGAAGGEKDPDKMSTAEWMAWRNKQVSNSYG